MYILLKSLYLVTLTISSNLSKPIFFLYDVYKPIYGRREGEGGQWWFCDRCSATLRSSYTESPETRRLRVELVVFDDARAEINVRCFSEIVSICGRINAAARRGNTATRLDDKRSSYSLTPERNTTHDDSGVIGDAHRNGMSALITSHKS